jgi:hypothetical protein
MEWGTKPIRIFLLAGFLLAGCASQSVVDVSNAGEGAPGWVNQGSSILKAKNGRVFLGVGSAPMLGDFSLQTATADQIARAEVSRVLWSFMEIVSRDYIASGEAEDAGFTEQSVARYMDQVDRMDLTGVRIVGHWQDTKTNLIYAIAEMDMQQARKKLEEMQKMNPGLKQYMGEEGEDIFDRLAKHAE